jgi:hypothetical protein
MLYAFFTFWMTDLDLNHSAVKRLFLSCIKSITPRKFAENLYVIKCETRNLCLILTLVILYTIHLLSIVEKCFKWINKNVIQHYNYIFTLIELNEENEVYGGNLML